MNALDSLRAHEQYLTRELEKEVGNLMDLKGRVRMQQDYCDEVVSDLESVRNAITLLEARNDSAQ